MASTVEASRLSEAHRVAQARLGVTTVRQMLAVWPLLDPSDLDGTFPRWLVAVRPIIGRQRDVSSRLAANFYTTFRTLELGAGVEPVTPELATMVEPGTIATSMLVTGPASIRSALARGVQFETAVQTAQANTARSAARHAMNGGRETVMQTMAADARSLGYARTTSGRACAFCALLASRGPVYSKDTVDFRAHDGCFCGVEPVYRELSREAWPGDSVKYREIYDQVAKGLPPKEAQAAFRKALAAGG